MARPTFRSMNESFEGWAWRAGLLDRVRRLEEQGSLECSGRSVDRVVKLTERGRLLALGGVDPTRLWDAQWDGKWRVVSFDLPETERKLRRVFRETLRRHNFGCLQRSLWITPHALGKDLLEAEGSLGSLKGLAVVEGGFAGKVTNAEVVSSAWDFPKIFSLYEEHGKWLDALPAKESSPEEFVSWAEGELERWRPILHWDPFLPQALLPEAYPGRTAWDKRLGVLKEFGKRAFGTSSQGGLEG